LWEHEQKGSVRVKRQRVVGEREEEQVDTKVVGVLGGTGKVRLLQHDLGLGLG
jgi:hypothetical protein